MYSIGKEEDVRASADLTAAAAGLPSGIEIAKADLLADSIFYNSSIFLPHWVFNREDPA